MRVIYSLFYALNYPKRFIKCVVSVTSNRFGKTIGQTVKGWGWEKNFNVTCRRNKWQRSARRSFGTNGRPGISKSYHTLPAQDARREHCRSGHHCRSHSDRHVTASCRPLSGYAKQQQGGCFEAKYVSSRDVAYFRLGGLRCESRASFSLFTRRARQWMRSRHGSAMCGSSGRRRQTNLL